MSRKQRGPVVLTSALGARRAFVDLVTEHGPTGAAVVWSLLYCTLASRIDWDVEPDYSDAALRVRTRTDALYDVMMND